MDTSQQQVVLDRSRLATIEQHELHTWATPWAVVMECLDCRAQRLSSKAHGGAYATWLSISAGKGNRYHRLGSKGIEAILPDTVLRNIVLNVGGPVYVKRSSRGRIPCLYLRARYGGDFRELSRAIATTVKSAGGWAIVLDATEPAQAIISRGI